jgi:hypothetical protein
MRLLCIDLLIRLRKCKICSRDLDHCRQDANDFSVPKEISSSRFSSFQEDCSVFSSASPVKETMRSFFNTDDCKEKTECPIFSSRCPILKTERSMFKIGLSVLNTDRSVSFIGLSFLYHGRLILKEQRLMQEIKKSSRAFVPRLRLFFTPPSPAPRTAQRA